MYPYLFGVKWLDMYTILMIVGMFAAVFLFKFICSKKKVDDKTYNFYAVLAVVSIALGLVFAFLFQSVYNWIESGFKHFELRGLTFMGGLIGGVATFVLGTLFFAKGQVKRNFWRIANYAAGSIVLGHAIGRLGCFCAGCCYGKPTDSFLGVVFPDLKNYPLSHPEYVATGGRAYPTQLFEALFLFVLFAVMAVLLFKYDKPNILLVLYGFSYAVFRFLIEFLRGDERGSFLPFLSPSQWQSLLLLLVTAALALLVYKFKIVPFANAPLTAAESIKPRPADSVLNGGTAPDKAANGIDRDTTGADKTGSEKAPTQADPFSGEKTEDEKENPK